jgi:hypothetical protein
MLVSPVLTSYISYHLYYHLPYHCIPYRFLMFNFIFVPFCYCLFLAGFPDVDQGPKRAGFLSTVIDTISSRFAWSSLLPVTPKSPPMFAESLSQSAYDSNTTTVQSHHEQFMTPSKTNAMTGPPPPRPNSSRPDYASDESEPLLRSAADIASPLNDHFENNNIPETYVRSSSGAGMRHRGQKKDC